jgi:5-amino-6-(5-phosphoribosylamino)uracil reductase
MKSRSRNSRRRKSASSARKSARPFVCATFAMTLDGKITTRNFTPVDFTSREDKRHLFRQRALADAVLLGHTTLERDNVRLGISEDLRQERMKCGQSPTPLRVVVSNQGRINTELKIFQWEVSPILIFSTKRMPRELRRALAGKATVHLSRTNDVDLIEMLQILRRDYKVRRVACEGGPTLFRSMLEHGLIDELNLTIAPYLFGGAGAPTLTGLSKEFLPASVQCVMKTMRVVGDECFMTYRIKSRR